MRSRRHDLARSRRLSLRLRQYLDAYWMIGPAFALYMMMVLYPIGREIVMSFHEWDVFSPMRWVGVTNYRSALADAVFLRGLSNNILYALVVTVAKNVFGLWLAILLTGADVKGRNAFRTAVFIPVTLSYVAVGMLWSWVFNPTFGLLNQVLRLFSIPASSGVLGNPRLSLWAIMFVDIWKWTGFHTVIFVAGLLNIPPELYESAAIDGAGSWQRFRCITLPGLKSVVEVSVLLAMVGAFVRNFDLVYVMTGGGPAHATEIVLTWMHKQAFQFLRFGYAAAQGVILFVLVMVLSALYLRALRRQSAS